MNTQIHVFRAEIKEIVYTPENHTFFPYKARSTGFRLQDLANVMFCGYRTAIEIMLSRGYC